MDAVTPDPRPGLTEWLQDHWPPDVVWSARWLRPLVRYHRDRHGRDATDSACCLAAVQAWDQWEPSRAGFETFVQRVAWSLLSWETRRERRLKRRGWLPPIPLEGWAVIDSTDPTDQVDARDAAEAVRRLAPFAADTLTAVAETDTQTAAARRLGLTQPAVASRLRRVREELAERIGYAEPDVDETTRLDVIVTETPT